MATWWSTEAIPIPATALLPILLIPALGIDSLNSATAPYANPTIYLFLGGFVLGLAMERWNLHKRIALLTLLAMGSQPSRQIAGFKLAGHDSGQLIRAALAALGPLSKGEKLVALVFLCTALAWVFQPLIAAQVPGVNDTNIAIAAALALFIIPVDARQRVFLMNWESAVKLPWGVLLLFGGGLSLAGVIRSTGLAEWIAQSLAVLGALPVLAMIGVVALVIIFLTEVTSNTATAAAAFLPLLEALAVAQGMPPELLAIPAAIAASCAFMMPVATPPNAIVFGSRHMRIQSMIKAGFALNLIGVLLVTLVSYLLVGLIWSH